MKCARENQKNEMKKKKLFHHYFQKSQWKSLRHEYTHRGQKKKNIATWRWRNEENNQNYHCQLYMVLRKLSFFVKITLLSSWMATKMTEQEARVFNSLLLKTWSWWSTGLHHQNLFYRRQPSHDPSKCFKKPKARRKATIIVQEIHDTLLKIVLTKTTLLPY